MGLPCDRRMLIHLTIFIFSSCNADRYESSIRSATNQGSIGSTCSITNQSSGKCVLLQDCSYAMSLTGSELLNYVRVASCPGSTDGRVILCCPNKVFRTIVSDTSDLSGPLIFPEDEEIFPQKTNILKFPLETSTNSPPRDRNSQARKTHSSTSSKLMHCESRVEKRIVGGEVSELDEFPWMALLFYSKVGRDRLLPFCGGTILTERYILTAAHCLKNPQLASREIRLRKIRVGEYDLRSQPDCVTNDFGQRTCASYEEFEYQETIIHEKYDMSNMRNRAYDIGLVRLSKSMRFTDNIQPICAPTGPIRPSQEFHAIGWGATENSSISDIRLSVKLSWFDLDRCNASFASRGSYLYFGQFCAGGRAGQDTCTGDSGGPLATPVKTGDDINYWTLAGITSFGHRNCGTEGIPAVYTNVWDFIPWIERNIED